MEVIIDGYIYQAQTIGGISRIFDNIIPKLCELDNQILVTLFLNNDPVKPLPRHKQISIINLGKLNRFIRPWRLWRKYYHSIHNILLRYELGNTQRKIWFSTYYTLPQINWNGYQVVLVHDFIYELFPSLFPDSSRQINRKKEAILKADALICVSKTTARDLERYYPGTTSKIHVVENGFDRIFRKKSLVEIAKKEEYPFILYVGKRKFYKGFDALLSSYFQWARHLEVKLVVVGESWSDDEEAFIQKKGLQDQVILIKNARDELLCDLYNQAKAFVYPSLYEGFGIPLLEAMACGCPIIASKIPSTLEIAKNVPFYFEPGDVQALIRALDGLLDNKPSEEKIQEGLSLVCQYSWERMASGILDVFKTMSQEQ